MNKTINAGEANVASSEITADGDLRISCNRGSFSSPAATHIGAYNMAFIIDEIQQDILTTFKRPTDTGKVAKKGEDIRILIENTDDNIEFPEMVVQELGKIDEKLAKKSRIVPSLKNVAPEERDRYLSAEELVWTLEERQKILLRVSQSGHKTQKIDSEKAFTDVRLTRLQEGETLVTAGAPPGFIYIAMDTGLLSTPLGGYQPKALKAWIPLGNTRVIRGSIQESTLTAETSLNVLMIPKSIYLKYWHDAYTPEELSKEVTRVYNEDKLHGFEQIFHILQQVALIDNELDDLEVEFIKKFVESHGIHYSEEDIRKKLLAEGESDFTSLRRSTVDYIASEPPYVQVARLRDLIHLLINADHKVSEEERLIESELNGLLGNYLVEEATDGAYHVLVIPQNPEQGKGFEALLPNPKKITNSWGQAYICGTYFSYDYAKMIVQHYRNLDFYAIIEREHPDL